MKFSEILFGAWWLNRRMEERERRMALQQRTPAAFYWSVEKDRRKRLQRYLDNHFHWMMAGADDGMHSQADTLYRRSRFRGPCQLRLSSTGKYLVLHPQLVEALGGDSSLAEELSRHRIKLNGRVEIILENLTDQQFEWFTEFLATSIVPTVRKVRDWSWPASWPVS